MNTVCRYHESIIPVKTTYKPKIKYKKRNKSKIIVVLNTKRKK